VRPFLLRQRCHKRIVQVLHIILTVRPMRQNENDSSRWLRPFEREAENHSSFPACTNLDNVSSGGRLVQLSIAHSIWHLPTILELNLLTGVAAILTYPLDVEVVEMEEREEEERVKNEKADKAHAAKIEESGA
jgi:hypothetical protein